MSSKKPIAVLMAAAMTVASLSAVSLYADDVVNNDTALLGGNSSGSSDFSDNSDVRIDDEEQDPADSSDDSGEDTDDSSDNSADTTPADVAPAVTTPEETPEVQPPAPDSVIFNEVSAGIVKGYLEMPHVPASLKGSSIADFEENMKSVSVSGETLSGASNNLTLNVDTLTGYMKTINGKRYAYAMLFRFDGDSVISTTKGYSITTSDIEDGKKWKAAHAPDDGYQYIVVWFNASTATTSITFREEKTVNNKKVVTNQVVSVIRRDITPYDPDDTTTPETTTRPEDLVSEISTDWPIKATVTDRRGTVDLNGYKLMIEPCNEVYLNSSGRLPELVAAIKDNKAVVYEINLEKNGIAKDFSGLFKVTMALPEKFKSVKDVYLYRASSNTYSSMDVADMKGSEISFSTYELGLRVIVSTVSLSGYTGEPTTGTGTGTGTSSPVITAGAGSALSGAEIQVYSSAVLPNGTRLQITALNTAQSNNKAVELAISEGKALAYDISLVNASGVAISQTGISSVRISFNVPSQFSGITPLYVYRMESNDTFTNMYAGLSGGKLSFATQHLSTYIISSVALDGSGTVTDNQGGAVNTTKRPSSNNGGNSGGNQVVVNPGNNDNDNVNTGFLFALVPVGLAAAGIAITRKKKR